MLRFMEHSGINAQYPLVSSTEVGATNVFFIIKGF